MLIMAFSQWVPPLIQPVLPVLTHILTSNESFSKNETLDDTTTIVHWT